jgi:hypothetical protein
MATYKIGDFVYILHDGNGRFHVGEVTKITPTGRINVRSECFTGGIGQFTPEGRLRGPDHHGGTHLLPAGDNPPQKPSTRPSTFAFDPLYRDFPLPPLLAALVRINRAANNEPFEPGAISKTAFKGED